MPAMSAPHYLFLTTSTREPGHLGNTEWLARQAAAALPAGTEQTWHHLARMQLPPFVDQRHTTGTCTPARSGMTLKFGACLPGPLGSSALTIDWRTFFRSSPPMM